MHLIKKDWESLWNVWVTFSIFRNLFKDFEILENEKVFGFIKVDFYISNVPTNILNGRKFLKRTFGRTVTIDWLVVRRWFRRWKVLSQKMLDTAVRADQRRQTVDDQSYKLIGHIFTSNITHQITPNDTDKFCAWHPIESYCNNLKRQSHKLDTQWQQIPKTTCDAR